MSVDPLFREYPELTPYQFASNTPIMAIDRDGLEKYHYNRAVNKLGETKLTFSHKEDFEEWSPTWNDPLRMVKNPRKDYVVHQMDKKYIAGPMDAYPVEYDETSTFGSYEEARKATNSDFTNTWEDWLNYHIPQLIQNLSENSGSSSGGRIAGIMKSRANSAKNFYRKFNYFKNKTAEGLGSHIEGIDLTKSVKEITLKKGTIVQQWVGQNGKEGNYYTTLSNGSNKNLGISYKDRVLKQYKLTNDVTVLKSTAAEYKGNKGGGTQYFNPELKNNTKEIK